MIEEGSQHPPLACTCSSGYRYLCAQVMHTLFALHKALSLMLSLCIYFTLKIHCLSLVRLYMPLIPEAGRSLSSSQPGLHSKSQASQSYGVRPFLQTGVKTVKSDVHLALQMDSSQMHNSVKSCFLHSGNGFYLLCKKNNIC